jgi:hypothetical protein
MQLTTPVAVVGCSIRHLVCYPAASLADSGCMQLAMYVLPSVDPERLIPIA